MNELIDLYLIDAGNSRIKLGLCANGEIIEIKYFDEVSFLVKEINNLIPIAVSSVLKDEFNKNFESFENPIFWIDKSVILPFKLNYSSPEKLGIDRICNVAALSKMNKESNRLSIDIGTCIKFDFLNANNEYEGGSISPGLNLRYKALQLFTDKLPLIEISDAPKLIGSSTKFSIQSGVQNGIKAEINGLIKEYKLIYPDLRIFVTGGDAHYFDLEQKNVIFADLNLTLKGIIEIYHLNV
jgi:type III pantothenate kinase